MKPYLSQFLIISFTAISLSCGEDSATPNGNNNPGDSIALRLTKLSNNEAFENPITFEYNSKGLLSKISETNFYKEIEYNSGNLPVKITEIQNGSMHSIITDIEWFDGGFNIIDGDNTRTIEDIYYLDSNDQIDSSITIRRDFDEPFDTTTFVNFTWIGNDSLVYERSYYDNGEMITRPKNYKFGSGNSPFRSINIALLIALPADFYFEFDNYQPNNTVIEYQDDIFGASINYDYNEKNYPVKAEINFSFLNEHEYMYFEYENVK